MKVWLAESVTTHLKTTCGLDDTGDVELGSILDPLFFVMQSKFYNALCVRDSVPDYILEEYLEHFSGLSLNQYRHGELISCLMARWCSGCNHVTTSYFVLMFFLTKLNFRLN